MANHEGAVEKMFPHSFDFDRSRSDPRLGECVRLKNGDIVVLDSDALVEVFKAQRELARNTVGLGSLGEEAEDDARYGVVSCASCGNRHHALMTCLPFDAKTYSELAARFVSLRSLLAAYWNAELSPRSEKLIEDAISPEERYRYKPCQ